MLMRNHNNHTEPRARADRIGTVPSSESHSSAGRRRSAH